MNRSVVHATRQIFRPAEKMAGKKLHNVDQNVLDHCKLETCTYISFAAI